MWQALLRGDDYVTTVPLERWDAEENYDPEVGVPGRSVSKWGAFLDDVAGFDADFFGIGDREATAADPQHRLLLETAWEAVEHAGIDPATLDGSTTGVFMGLTTNDYQLIAADAHAIEGPYGLTHNNYSMASGRIAFHLGLRGPAFTVDSACSSGLLAVHMATRSLHLGESDMVLAGGAHIILDPRKYASASAQGMLSGTGRCHAFDVNADGFVFAEASAVLLLKRLDDAERDGDRILAVVRGTAANQDGHTVNILTPSNESQVAVYRTALASGAIDPGTVGYVEAHGTGTPVGDPIEFKSLADVYGGTGPIAIGSSKTNFGHSQSASGVVGVIKSVLALQHGVIPPNLHFTRMPEEMKRLGTEFFVPTETIPFPDKGDRPRRAAVSAYGISGSNAHAVLEQAPQANDVSVKPAEGEQRPLLFALSSTSADELRRTAGRLADWVADHPDVDLHDLGYTLARRRSHRSVRTTVVADSTESLLSALREVADGGAPYEPAVSADDCGPVWVFSGQGSQWAGMGAGLLASQPVFAATVAELEPLIADESGFSVTEAMSAPETVTGISKVQPTVFAVQVALAATLKAYGVVPGAVIGHSMGEIAAAVAADVLTLQDAVKVICRRSELMGRVAGTGAMASVEMPAKQVLSELQARGVTDVVLAVVASPTSTVVGGTKESVRALVTDWQRREIMAREVAVDVASHTPQVDPILDDLADALADLDPGDASVPYYSATMYDPRDLVDWDADYWVDNLRHTVRFAAAVQAALEDGYRVFTELSPHPLLTHAVDQTARSLDIAFAALASVRREQELPFGLLTVVGELHNAGAKVDFSVLYPGGRLVDAPLPTWTRRPLMLTRDPNELPPGGSMLAVHPLLGAHVRLPEEPERHAWQADVGTTTHPWLDDHQVYNVAALPGAAYCEMALAAAKTVLGDAAEVHDISFDEMLLLEGGTVVSAASTVTAPGTAGFLVETYEQGEQVTRSGAVLRAAEDSVADAARSLDIDALLAAHPKRLDGAELRVWYSQRGIQYGPAFAGLVAVNVNDGGDGPDDSVLAEVRLPGSIRSQQAAYCVHPALLDACFQAVGAHPAIFGDTADSLLLPLGVRRLRTYGSTRNVHYCHARLTGVTAATVEVDLYLLDEDGNVLLEVTGLRLGTGVSDTGQLERTFNDRLLTIEWSQQGLPEAEAATPGSWLLISTSCATDLLAIQLADALEAYGADVTTMVWPQHVDHDAEAVKLRELLAANVFGDVLVVTPSRRGVTDEQSGVRGGDNVRHLVHIVRELPEAPGPAPRLHVVTRHAQTVLSDDAANLDEAGIRGLMRVVGTEYPQLRVTQIDVDDDTAATAVAAQLVSGSDEDETAWRGGTWFVARLVSGPLRPDERRTRAVNPARDGLRLQIRTPGDIETLELAAFERVEPGPGQIEVAVTASNLNFADVLIAFGRYPSFEGRQPKLGGDFAGVVTAVGPGVTGHKVGDRVGGISADGAWATFVTCDANLAVTLPPGLPTNRAAAVPSAHATAWYGLHDLARIAAGDKVLIHSGTGGVGQAAIAIARAAGADIYATAGSEARRELLRGMGIEHVYDSRSTDFADQIRRDTSGYGVDIVLNSLTGAAQRAGLELLSFGGRFVEIGKRDIYGDTRMGLFPFRRNLSFFAVDLALLTLTNSDTVHRLLEVCYQQIADGVLPLPQTTHYPLEDGATAIRVMGAAEHTGKLVLDIPRSGQINAVVPPEETQAVRGDGAYIVTGGLGGLGLFLAEKLGAAGCGLIVLNGRSAPSQNAQEVIERIRRAGAEVEVCLGDIAEPETAERLVVAACATGLTLRGVLHGAAVIEDAALTNISDELVERDWAPKVYGAWNLHTATARQTLDWFCMFSSAAALVGSPGQGAYAAANSWLDAFAHWRRTKGLPANAIAWGPWSEIGAGTGLASESGEAAIGPDEGAYAFDRLLRHDRAYAGYASLSGSSWITAFAQNTRFAEAFRSTGPRVGGASSAFLTELHDLPRDEWPARTRKMVAEQVSLILRRAVDPDRPLAEYGLDSLGTLEVRTRIEAETGIRIGSADISTVRALTERLADALAPDSPVSVPS
jgi:polyketide synthase 5